ncbi:MAG: hypothetical protein OEM24_06290 [Paracoccaceae bacterium]|nr:hypothetical protein [Paracoccaceae bacterium]
MRRVISLALLPALGLAWPAFAHATEGGFVLLLPTAAYIAGGVVTVVLTVLLVSALPGPASERLYAALPLWRSRGRRWRRGLALPGFAAFAAVLVLGLLGPHDPSRNLLPLSVWTLFWLGMPVLHALAGDLWRDLNPWAWPLRLCRRAGLTPRFRLPSALGHWLALASFLAFAAVLLAHPAPADPETLAAMAASYWAVHFAGGLLFGPRWLRRAEGFAVLFAAYARLAPLAAVRGRWRLGLPGWQIATGRAPPPGLAVFALAMLAVGSFDGLNETFLWIAALGLNPLEFPGRSAVVAPNLAGLLLAVPALVAAFAATVWLGFCLAGRAPGAAFAALAPAVLPIALGYHVAHYLPSSLVEGQYLALALNDPLGRGGDLLGLWRRHVTTGFFTSLSSVRVIWLTQAGAVVLGHVLAILLGHVQAYRLLGSQRGAAISQLPLAAFMVAYTLFGLWLLATPRGV